MKLAQSTTLLAISAGMSAGVAHADLFADYGEIDLLTNRIEGEIVNICIELDGAGSWDELSDISNFTMSHFLGVGSVIVGAEWVDAVITTNGNSFLNEATISLDGEIALQFGAADNFGGTGTYNSDGVVDFIAEDIEYELDDGFLDLEFFETTDDDADAVDANYTGGQLYIYYIAVPAPGSLALLGAGGLLMGRRRRA